MSNAHSSNRARKSTLELLDRLAGSRSLGARRPSFAPLLLAFLDSCSEHQQPADREDKGEAAVAGEGTPSDCKKQSAAAVKNPVGNQ